MEQAIPIKTPVGILNGRDCIYINRVIFDDLDNLKFYGELNEHLVAAHNQREIPKKLEWISYELTFKRVLSYFACELDTYENLVETSHLNDSSFDIIEQSSWLRSFPIRKDFDRSMYKHYRIFTYDVVFNIIAVDYDIDIQVKY